MVTFLPVETHNFTDTVQWNISLFQNDTEIYPEGAVWNVTLIQRVVTLGVIMTATLLGNVVIVLVLSKLRYRKRSSRVNIFILNLAVGDLAVCGITMTSELLFEVFGEWVLGEIACKVIVYAQIVTLASTTFILTSMSYDRYQAICKPLQSTVGAIRAKKLIFASWTLAFIVALPQLFIFVQKENGITTTGRVRYECVSQGYTAMWQRKVYFTWLTTYILIIPTICISYCYVNVLRALCVASRENPNKNKKEEVYLRRSVSAAAVIPRAKIKTLKLTVCIIASFVICWTPYFIVHNIRIYSNYSIQVPKVMIVGAETLALLNSALNPIFYGYFNVRVRKGFIEIVYRKKDFHSCVAASQSYSNPLDSVDNPYSTAVVQNHNVHRKNLTEGFNVEMWSRTTHQLHGGRNRHPKTDFSCSHV
ncbi:putative gonadotropin-releasing hormone II receptor [Limulus polyphemus]|uniref:Gonadotropin-releasing hormone II receptor n=1 Tax=Limulus polyphemus TaxID=6850 RepID=A0ABM1SGC7_LIMPO|nr:putative gonadotropin-releasing hormone II receptor [Limulus polyphemus]